MTGLLFYMAILLKNLTMVTDGPYLFYRDGTAVVSSVYRNKLKAENYSEKEIRHNSIDVRFDHHPDWDFKVKLQEQITIEPAVYAAPEKVFVVSDIEGEFEVFRKLLLANKIMDEKYHWKFGKGHVVINGDLFDRGKDVPQFLWLLYKLEQEAREKGGYLHTILGNHDIMNLSGDLRFVEPKYMQAAKMMGISYMKFYDENTELGRWLRSKNMIEKIGDNLFLHAGVAPEVNALHMSVAEINSLCRPYYAAKKKDIPESLQLFFGKKGPFWYRGYFMSPRTSMETIDSTLNLYQCSHIVVGHTILERNIALYYEGKVIGVDVDAHLGKCNGALFKDGTWWLMQETGKIKLLKYQSQNDQIKDEDIK